MDLRLLGPLALDLCHEAGGEEIVDEVLLATAALAATDSDLPRAARLAGAAERYTALPHTAEERKVFDRLYVILEHARLRADPDEWERAVREGAQLDLDEAIADARSGLTIARQTSAAPGPADALS